MKRFILITAAILCILASATTTNAQTIHVILYANTIDEGIGETVKIDVKRVKNEIGQIAQYIGYNVSWSIATTADDCTKGGLFSDLNSLQPNSNDIIFFYYSGHGRRDQATDTDPFPRMCLTESDWSNHPQVAEVRNILSSKNARLKIIVTDCCNNDPSVRGFSRSYSKGATYSKGTDYANYKKLFVETKGEVVITSSKIGQTSGCNEDVGGYLTYMFFLDLHEAAENASTSNWNTILENTKKDLVENTPKHQEPYYLYNGQSSASGAAPAQPSNNTVYPANPQLASLFTNLINKNRTIDSRLSMVNNVLSNFTADAQVITLGSDMKTIVDREPAEKFLKRICMSPNLVQINVVDEQLGYGGKKKLLFVHEIRTKLIY